MKNVTKTRFFRSKLLLFRKLTISPDQKKVVFSWLLAWVYCGMCIFVMLGPLFRFSHFSCSTSIGLACPDFVVPEIEKLKNQLVFVTGFESLEAKIKFNIPQAESVELKPVWPNRLHADLLWQRPIANLSIPASHSAYIVSSTNQLMGVVDKPMENLPEIIASSAADLIISDQLSDPSLLASFEALKLLDLMSIGVIRINVVTSQDIRLELKNGYITLITSLRPVSDQLKALQLILSQSTMDQKLPVIDVRVDRPVLKPLL